MSSHQLAIAKASFSAGLLRPDPQPVARDEISHFHTLLNVMCQECSPMNVQNCKRWILKNIVQSTARFAALDKYLVALSTSFSGSPGQKPLSTSKREPSSKRKRLHLLYLLNDLLHHAKFQVHDASIPSKVQPLLLNLIIQAASFDNSPKHIRKLNQLLDIWEDKDYYSKEYLDKLREAIKNAKDTNISGGPAEVSAQNGDTNFESKSAKNIPFMMPAMHGDPSTPWYDLPAGNLLPHIVPNSTRAMNPEMVKPLRFVAGPPENSLVAAVKGLLEDVDMIFSNEKDWNNFEDVGWDINELGQRVIRDEVTGDIVRSEGYYGWSTDFCDRMKRRHKGPDARDSPPREDRGRMSRRSSSRSDTDSLSPDNRYNKRRRFSSSDGNGGRSRSGSRNDYRRARSPVRSRSPSIERDRFVPNNRPSSPLSTNPPSTFAPPSNHHFGPGFPPPPPPPPPVPGQYSGPWPPPPPPPPFAPPFNQQPQSGGAWQPSQFAGQGFQPWQQPGWIQPPHHSPPDRGRSHNSQQSRGRGSDYNGYPRQRGGPPGSWA